TPYTTATPRPRLPSPRFTTPRSSQISAKLTTPVMEPWEPGGRMSTRGRRAHHRHHGRPNWRIVRYADDFVVLADGCHDDVARLREDIADVLHPLGLRLSPAKTQIVHMSDGFDFLGFPIQWRRKRGSNKWYVYTFIAERPIRQLKDKVRALTNRTSQQDPGTVLKRINSILRGWVNYFRHAVCKTTLKALDQFVWRRVTSWWMVLYRWRWKDIRRRFTDRTAGGTSSRRTGSNCSPWSRSRSPATDTGATRSPTPGHSTTLERQRPWRARCGESVRRFTRRWIAPAGAEVRKEMTLGSPQGLGVKAK
ncbi:group II intron maturase-specific domain-containing protein, partial [Streptomyces mirabilis]